MKRNFFKIIALLLLLGLFGQYPAYANGTGEVDETIVEYGEPNLSRWVYTTSTSQDLSISNGVAGLTTNVSGNATTVTKIVAYTYLQKYEYGSWGTVVRYRDEVAGPNLLKYHTYSPLDSGYTYRIRTVIYVYGPDEYHYDYITKNGPERYY